MLRPKSPQSSFLPYTERLVQNNGDNILFSGAERLLQIAAEECINIGLHVIAGLNLEKADSYKEMFNILAVEGFISEDTRIKMMKLTDFRNRLVHLYINQYDVLENDKNLEVLVDSSDGDRGLGSPQKYPYGEKQTGNSKVLT